MRSKGVPVGSEGAPMGSRVAPVGSQGRQWRPRGGQWDPRGASGLRFILLYYVDLITFLEFDCVLKVFLHFPDFQANGMQGGANGMYRGASVVQGDANGSKGEPLGSEGAPVAPLYLIILGYIDISLKI